MNQIFNENCLETMERLPPDSIDLVVTSPPYDNLRSYENGYSFDFNKVKEGLFKVLKTGGILVWVVSDETKDCDESGTSFRQALAFKDIGFKLNDTMIYRKKAQPMPSNYKYNNEFEYMFVFSKKDKPKTVNLLKDKPNSQAGKKISIASSTRNRDGSMKRMNDINKAIRDFGTRGNVWDYDVGWMKSYKESYIKGHPATFPEKLAEDHILSWSNVGDVVYDPFMGSGTTCIMAATHGRKFIGSEIVEGYFEIAKRRVGLYL